MNLLDHRAILPHDLLYKTGAAISALSTVRTHMLGPVDATELVFFHAITRQYDADPYESGPCMGEIETLLDTYTEFTTSDPGSLTGNSISNGYSGSGHSAAPDEVDSQILIQGSPVGPPAAFKDVPDNWELVSATAEITSPSCTLQLTTSTQTVTGGGTGVLVDTVVTDTSASMTYTVLAVLKGGGHEVIGSCPAPSTSHIGSLTSVEDFTDIAQAMWARKRDGVTIGYMIISSLGVFSDMSVAEMTEASLPAQSGELYFPAVGCPFKYNPYRQWYSLEWGNPSIGALNLEFAPPELTNRDVVPPRWPVLPTE